MYILKYVFFINKELDAPTEKTLGIIKIGNEIYITNLSDYGRMRKLLQKNMTISTTI